MGLSEKHAFNMADLDIQPITAMRIEDLNHNEINVKVFMFHVPRV